MPETDSKFYDALEIRTPENREKDLFEQLPGQIRHAQKNTVAYASILNDFEASDITSREALAALPVTRKSELSRRQSEMPPFGGLVATERKHLQKIFSSPGPIYEPQSRRNDYWRLARALYAAGFRSGDVIHNTYSYHLTPAGSMLESGAFALGCGVVPGGAGQTEQQAVTIADIKPEGYVGTPSFLKIILDKARELNIDCSSITHASVSGEALPESLRDDMQVRGVRVLQSYATADLGLIAYESEARQGMILDENIIVEILRPGSGEPVAQGEVGEVVVTTFNPDYPLIRFATGDLSAILEGPSPCGRTNARIKGWMGRADQTVKVRGMFVRPEQVNAVADRFNEINHYRLIVSRPQDVDVLTLRCECNNGNDDLKQAITETVRELCKLRATVEFVDDGQLPNDGKIIEDVRTYD